MHPAQVVVLLEVLRDKLPVGFEFEIPGEMAPPTGEAVAGKPLIEVTEPVLDRWRLVGQTDEQEALPGGHSYLVESVVGRVESVHAGIGELGSGHQASVPVVGPTVVGAADGRPQGAVALQQLCAAMSTSVEVTAQVAVLVAGEDHRTAGHRSHDGATRSVQLIVSSHADPGGGKDSLLLLGVKGRVGVYGGREGVSLQYWAAGTHPGLLGGPVGPSSGGLRVG